MFYNCYVFFFHFLFLIKLRLRMSIFSFCLSVLTSPSGAWGSISSCLNFPFRGWGSLGQDNLQQFILPVSICNTTHYLLPTTLQFYIFRPSLSVEAIR